MTLEEVLDLGSHLAGKFHGKFAAPGKIHPLYQKTVDILNQLKVHYVYGTSPSELIEKVRPNESSHARTYRIESYEQATFAYSQKIIGLQRGSLFNPDLYSLEYPDRFPVVVEDQNIKEYLKKLPVIGVGIEAYMRDFVHQVAMVDPNGWIAIIPELTDEELAGNRNAWRRPYPTYIPSKYVLDFGNDYMIARSSESVDIGMGNLVGEVFFLFTPDYTIKLTEQPNRSSYSPEFAWELIEAHEGGTMRARQLGGIVAILEDQVLVKKPQQYYLSHLQPTVPHFNLALEEKSDLQASITAHLFPRLYEAQSDCPKCGSRGYIGDDTSNTCTTCNGIGKIVSANTPLISYIVEPDAEGRVHPPAGYINLDTGIVETARAISDADIKEAFRSVNMEMLYDTLTSAQTAEAKRYDREGLHNHLRQVSQTIFGMYQWVLDQINEVRYGPVLNAEELEQNRVIVRAPRTFDTTLPAESVNLIKEGKEAGLHRATLIQLNLEAIDRLFGHNSVRGKLAKIALRFDPLALLSPDDILAIKGGLVDISDQDLQLHLEITEIVNACYQEDPSFVNWMYEDQKQAILDKLESMMPERQQQIPSLT